MNHKPDHAVRIDVGASARLNVDVKAEIPTSSVGRFVDAITDMLRPLSEHRALKADLIRLQREDVAVEIARRAKDRLELEERPLHPIPLKVLIPLLEKGSQEAPDDSFMIDMWANLLASATGESSISPRVVGVLGELNGRQARLMIRIATQPDPSGCGKLLYDKMFTEKLVLELLGSSRSVKEALEAIVSVFRYRGALLRTLQAHTTDEMGCDGVYNGNLPKFDETLRADLGVLTSLNLLELTHIKTDSQSQYDI
jgi:hypothetical protein